MTDPQLQMSIAELKRELSSDEKTQFDLQYGQNAKNPSTALIISLFFGFFGIDRFYIGHTGLGVLKLITFGGCMIWGFVDLFLIMGATRKRNIDIARETLMVIKHSRS